jgi:hypothetical protein
MKDINCLYLVEEADTFSYQILQCLQRYQPDLGIAIAYLRPGVRRYEAFTPTDPVLAHCRLYRPAAQESGPAHDLYDLCAASRRVVFQSLHADNAPVFLEGLARRCFDQPPLFLMLDDEIDRLDHRTKLHAGGLPLERIDAALREAGVPHTPELTEAYAKADHYLMSQPFCDVLSELLQRELVLYDYILPISFAMPALNPARSALHNRSAVTAAPFRLCVYTKQRNMTLWQSAFLSFLNAQTRYPERLDVTLFGQDGLGASVQATFAERAPGCRTKVSNISHGLPLSAYLELFEHMDALVIQHRGGVSAVKHAVNRNVALLYDTTEYATGGQPVRNYNLDMMRHLGLTCYATLDEVMTAAEQGSLHAALARNRVMLGQAELRSVNFFLDLFAPL